MGWPRFMNTERSAFPQVPNWLHSGRKRRTISKQKKQRKPTPKGGRGSWPGNQLNADLLVGGVIVGLILGAAIADDF
jgi:hypothetical protein